MNRQIKFRAWNNETKQFELPLYRGVANLNINDILRGSTLLYQQFTGLLDKNGKEIYEGDIVLYPDTESEYVDVGVGSGLKVAETQVNSFGEVKFQEGTFGIICPKGSETLEKGFKSFWWIINEYGFELNELEVIGNIYENPELIKIK